MTQVVIEGPDGSGKSTLARKLSESSGLRIITGRGPEKYPGEINHRAREWLSINEPCIFDRHPCVSHPIYSEHSNGTSMNNDLVNEFYHRVKKLPMVLVYCRGHGLDDHLAKEYDKPNHLKMLEECWSLIEVEYEYWGSNHAHLIYDRGEDNLEQTALMIRTLANV